MKLIKTESGIIAVSEEDKNDKSFFEKGGILNIIAGTPDTLKLKFSPEVADVLGVWDANVLSIKEYERHSKKDNTLSLNEQIQRTGAYNVGFYEGFTSHAELTKKKEFTEEDLYNLMKMLRDTESRNMYEVFTRNFIQSLREFEVETFEIIGDTLTIIKLK